MIEMKLLGNAYERGFTHGKAYRAFISERCARTPIRTRAEDRTAHRLWTYFEGVLPALANEVKGLADGADLPLIDVFTMTAAPEVFYERSTWVERCTNIAALGDDVIMAKNSDGDVLLERYGCVQRIFPDEGFARLQASFVGGVGISFGLNEMGVGYVGASLPARTEVGLGVPSTAIAAHALTMSRSAEQAAALAAEFNVTGHGAHFLWADTKEHVFRTQLMPDGNTVSPRTSSWTVQTNIPPNEQHVDQHNASVGFRRNSKARLSRALAFGERWPTEPEALFDLMRTHGPGGLCQHGDEDLYTVLSGVLRLRARRLSVAFGAPCAQEYIDYNLEDDHAV